MYELNCGDINNSLYFNYIENNDLNKNKIVELIEDIKDNESYSNIYSEINSNFQKMIGTERILRININNIRSVKEPTKIDYEFVLTKLDNM